MPFALRMRPAAPIQFRNGEASAHMLDFSQCTISLSLSDRVAGGKMAGFRWTEAMGVGVPALDSDHKCMVRIINLLREACEGDDAAATIQTVLDTLKLYGRFHFKREERVMETVRFPGAAFHRVEHQSFAGRIDELRYRTRADKSSETADSIYDFLTGWLRHHILIQDMAYKPYIRNREEAERVARGAAPLIPDLFESTVDA